MRGFKKKPIIKPKPPLPIARAYRQLDKQNGQVPQINAPRPKR